MKLSRLFAPALMAASLFAQGPGGMAPGGMGPDGMGMGPRGPRGRGAPMGMRDRGMGRREPELGRLLSDPAVRQQLGVTADQAAKIRQQESDFRKAEIRNSADLQVKRMDLNDLLAADKPDRAAIDSKLREISAAQLAVEKAEIDNRLNMRDALTPAQRQRLQQMMAQRSQPVAPRDPQGGAQAGGRGGGRGAAPPANPPGQRPPNQ